MTISIERTLQAILDAGDTGDTATMRGHALDLLAHLRMERVGIDRDITITAHLAKQAGMTWQEIGKQLGTSRQAAYQRYGKK